MKQNKELINKLKQQVRESSVKGGQLKKIIDNLTEQMEKKDQQLQSAPRGTRQERYPHRRTR